MRQIGVTVRVIPKLVAIGQHLLGELWIVVNPVAGQKEGHVNAALAQDSQDLWGCPAAFGAGIEGQRHDAGGRVAADDF
jgi:hypothetical protein